MRVVLVGALNGAFAVAMGAFGAHLMEGRLEVADPSILETAVRYQLIHAVLLVGLGALKGHVLDALLSAASWALSIGVILFSFSLYLLALGGPSSLGFATPVGGGLLVIGWLLLGVAAARRV